VSALSALTPPAFPGADPDRASFTIALNAARDQPPRRLRTSPRVVKRAISKYNARGKVDRATYKATIAITIRAAPLTPHDEP
jgi:hypothetical protein